MNIIQRCLTGSFMRMFNNTFAENTTFELNWPVTKAAPVNMVQAAANATNDINRHVTV
jgi:hypothetical protein